MTISGFTMVKNAAKLYYPIKAVIQSVLPIVDEFVVALGDGDPDDTTLQEINSIGSSKIKIIHTKWDIQSFPNGMENAHQTDIAMKSCTGDWLFYLQADEVVHEKYLDTIYKRCSDLKDDERVEGLLFNYLHFWGDYQHYAVAHGWYPYEIRIVRNKPDIHSFESAQSFRRIPTFDGKSYRQKNGAYKLNVAPVDAYIYHYGWVRPPHLMQAKSKSLETIHKGSEWVENKYGKKSKVFDYGPLGRLPVFKGTHPEVMKSFIEQFDWAGQLNYKEFPLPKRSLFKHERLKYRCLNIFEQNLMGGKQIFSYQNWNLMNV
ncbi:MAG: hypothetical protein IPP77_12480 [Bacteroidetes bacterium]|nr:hypothetical protein [Bacteroidota bacterium]